MTSSTPSAAKLPTVKLGLGPMVVFNGAPEKFPWFWKKFRAYCMKKPEVWAVLSKQKGRRTQLSFHAEATGDTKRFFPIFEDRNANNTITDDKKIRPFDSPPSLQPEWQLDAQTLQVLHHLH